jgi:hypothetical protein
MSAIDHDTIAKYLSGIVRSEAIKMNVSTPDSVFTYGLILHFSFFFYGLKFAYSSKFFRNFFSLQRGTVLKYYYIISNKSENIHTERFNSVYKCNGLYFYLGGK